MARRDKTWSSSPFLPSRENQVRWHEETKHGHPHPFCHLETIKSDDTQRQIMVIRTLFAIPRQASSMARRDKTWSSAPFFPSRDNQVRWHVEKNYGHPPPLPSRDNQVWWHAEANMVIRSFDVFKTIVVSFAINRKLSLMAHRDKLWSFAPFSEDNNVFSHCMLSTSDDDPHLHFEDDNIFSHCMLSKGDNDLHLHFEDDNVFSHCIPSKGDNVLICISRTTVSSVIACF